MAHIKSLSLPKHNEQWIPTELYPMVQNRKKVKLVCTINSDKVLFLGWVQGLLRVLLSWRRNSSGAKAKIRQLSVNESKHSEAASGHHPKQPSIADSC